MVTQQITSQRLFLGHSTVHKNTISHSKCFLPFTKTDKPDLTCLKQLLQNLLLLPYCWSFGDDDGESPHWLWHALIQSSEAPSVTCSTRCRWTHSNAQMGFSAKTRLYLGLYLQDGSIIHGHYAKHWSHTECREIWLKLTTEAFIISPGIHFKVRKQRHEGSLLLIAIVKKQMNDAKT